MGPSNLYIPETYAELRDWFRSQAEYYLHYFPGSSLGEHSLVASPELTIDWLDAPSRQKERLLIITTGLHGTEGFTGTGILHQFLNSYLPRLDHQHVGLFLIHAINPWGMHHRRRTNRFNVDLNRNFRFDAWASGQLENPGYRALRAILHPVRPLGSLHVEAIHFMSHILASALIRGIRSVKEAGLMGQVEDPQGLYFGGTDFQEESRVAWGLITDRISQYRQVIHLDIHTGYGARNSLSLVNSVQEETPPDQWKGRFKCPNILRADPGDFYTIQGDMIEALYSWTRHLAPQSSYFGTAFEFGTLGDGLLAQIRSLAAMVFENQAAHHGARSDSDQQVVREAFREVFDPPGEEFGKAAWRSSQAALGGILEWFGCLR